MINSLAPRTADLTGHVPLAAVCALMAGPEKAARRRWRCAPTPMTAASRRAGVHQTVRAASARRDGSARRVASRPSALLTTVARATVSASKVVVRASRVGAVTTWEASVSRSSRHGVLCSGRGKCSTAHVNASMATPARRAGFIGCPGGCSGTASAVQHSASATPDGRAFNARTALVRVAAMAAAGARMVNAYVSRDGLAWCESKACPGNGCSGNGRCVLAAGKCECGSGWQERTAASTVAALTTAWRTLAAVLRGLTWSLRVCRRLRRRRMRRSHSSHRCQGSCAPPPCNPLLTRPVRSSRPM